MVATYRDKEPQQCNYLKRIVKPLAALGVAALGFLTNGCYSAPKYSSEKQPMAMHAPADSLDSLIAFKQDEQPQDSPKPKAEPQSPPDQESYLGTTPEEIELEKQAYALYKPATLKYNSIDTVDDKTAEELASDIAKSYWLFRKAEEANPANEAYKDFIKSAREWVGLVKYKKSELTEEEPELDKYLASFQPKPPKETPEPQTLPEKTVPAAAPTVPAEPKVNKHPLRFDLEDGAMAWAEYMRVSRESSEIDRVQAGFSGDYGLFGIDILGQGHKNKWREAVSTDRIIDEGHGGYLNARLWALEASVAQGNNTRRRTSHKQNVTSDPNFTITDTTRAVELLESNYQASRVALLIGKLKPELTLWEGTDDLTVDVDTIVDVINHNDPAGNYTSTINTSIAKEIKRRGLMPRLTYGEVVTDLGIASFGGLFRYERIELTNPDEMVEEYGITALADFTNKNKSLALSLAAGRRWVDDSESNRNFDPVHGHVTAAADLEQLIGASDTTLFASFWRRDEPGAGAGFVFGDNAVPLVMNYRNAVAMRELEFMNHMAPEERNVYVRMMQHNLIRRLGEDNKLRLLLFAGSNRNTINGEKEWNTFGEGVLTLPIVEDYLIAPYVRLEDNGRRKVKEAGIYLGPVFIGGGRHEEEGTLHRKSSMLKAGINIDF